MLVVRRGLYDWGTLGSLGTPEGSTEQAAQEIGEVTILGGV